MKSHTLSGIGSLLVCLFGGLPVEGTGAILKRDAQRRYVASFNSRRPDDTAVDLPVDGSITVIGNDQAAAWMEQNVPLFECSDKDIEETYHFRWWTYRKHVKNTPGGFVVTEFLPKVVWSGNYNTINCPVGHHLYEGRWIRNPKVLNDYTRFHFGKGGDPGGASKRYSQWIADGIYANYLVHAVNQMKSIVLKVITHIFFITGAVHAEEDITVQTQDNGAALVNPEMGWVAYFYSNVPANYGSHLAPADTADDFPGLSTVFLRIPWAMLEPKEGKFNWALLDTPAQRWIAKGKRVALCLTSSENWMTYATPEWVKNAGAKGTFYEFGKGRVEQGHLWDPFFDDPIYLAKLDAFLAAAAKRYDGNPNVEFVTVGTYGLWGEGHTHMSSQQDSIDIKKKHIDIHLKHFNKTQLCISDDYAGHNIPGRGFPITDYALSRGVTLRDDSILVQPPPNSWYHAELAQAFWPKFPVILEHEHYGGSKARGAWDGALLLKAVEDYHASFMSIHWSPREFLQENRETIDRINQRMGYRLQPLEVTWSKAVEIGVGPTHADSRKGLEVKWTWANKGVAPCHPGGFPCLTLKDAQGGIISVLTDESLDMRDLKVGPPGEPPATAHVSQFTIGQFAPVTQSGSYELYISVGTRDGTPMIALPLAGDDGQRRYRLGTVTLRDPGKDKSRP